MRYVFMLTLAATLWTTAAYAQEPRGYVEGNGALSRLTGSTSSAGVNGEVGINVAPNVVLFGNIGNLRDIHWSSLQTSVDSTVTTLSTDDGLTATAHDIKVHPDGYLLEGWRVVHGDGRLPAGRVVCGHLHPAVRLAGQMRPCFLVGERQIVLPAFSPDARGAAAAPGKRFRRLVPVGSEVLDFGPG